MKNISLFRISAIALLSAIFTACELDYAPENTYVDSKVFRTAKTAEATLAGAYVRLNVFLSGAPQDQNNYSNNADVFLTAELGTENIKVRENSSDYLAIETSEYSSSIRDGIVATIWRRGYNAIDFANSVISGIGKYVEFDTQLQRQYIAEARFIRAYLYFQMLSLFGDQALQGNTDGDGLVIQTEPYDGYDPANRKGRSSNAECWALIIGDLEAAINDLSDEVPAINKRVRANKTVARALLSRVLLYKATATDNREELQRAADLAQMVLDNHAYTFATSSTEYTANLFPSNEYSQESGYPDPTSRSGELIFFEASRLFTDNYPNGMHYYTKYSYYVPDATFDAYDANDVRRTQLLVQGSKSDSPSNKTTAKYCGGNYDDVLYIRLAEMKLTRAEALVRATGNIAQEAIDHLNDIHQRAFPDEQKPALYTIADFDSVDDFLRAVLHERRLELAYEGHYRWDLMRTDNLLGDTRLAAIAKNRWNLPVPDYEIRITKQLIRQNNGYVE